MDGDIQIAPFMPIIRFFARRYATRLTPAEDLIGVGMGAAWEAKDKFDPARGTPYVKFVRYFVRGRIIHYLRDYGQIIRVSAYAQEQGRTLLVEQWPILNGVEVEFEDRRSDFTGGVILKVWLEQTKRGPGRPKKKKIAIGEKIGC